MLGIRRVADSCLFDYYTFCKVQKSKCFYLHCLIPNQFQGILDRSCGLTFLGQCSKYYRNFYFSSNSEHFFWRCRRPKNGQASRENANNHKIWETSTSHFRLRHLLSPRPRHPVAMCTCTHCKRVINIDHMLNIAWRDLKRHTSLIY